MSFKVTLQSAPELRGAIGTPSAWAGASSSAVTGSGVYVGTTNKTYTFTADSSGSIGSGDATVSWDDGEGNEGTLYLGTTYTAGNARLVHQGVYLAFAAGNLVASDTFTLAVTASRRVRADHAQVDGDADPTDVAITSIAVDNSDIVQDTHDGRKFTSAIAQRLRVDLVLDYLTDAEVKTLERMRTSRYPIVVQGNYGKDTAFWHPGGAALPVIGSVPDYGALTGGSYRDAETGLFRVAASGALRTGPGVEEDSRVAGSTVERESIPLEFPHVGRGLVVGSARTNDMTTFHPASGALVWTTHSGSPSTAWEDQVAPVLDPNDTGWEAKFRGGCLRSLMTTGDAIKTPDYVVTGNQTFTAQVWIKGTPGVVFQVLLDSGVGSAGTNRASATSTATDLQYWRRISCTGTIPTGDNRARLRIAAVGTGIVYVSAAQIEVGSAASEIIQTDGAADTRDAYELEPVERIPNGEGSLAFWVWWPGTISGAANVIFENSGAGTDFRVELDPTVSPHRIRFHTDSSGSGNSLSASVPGSVLQPLAWHHVAVTWKVSGLAASMARALYLNGTQIASDDSTSWGEWTDPFVFGDTALAGPARYQDIRIDRRALTEAEIVDMYDAIASDSGGPLYRRMVGREFRIASFSTSWMSSAQTGKYLAFLQLEESNRDDDNVVVAP